MLGDILSEEEIRGQNIDVETYNTSVIVSTMLKINYNTRNHRKINCVIVAAVNMNGLVSIAKGGLEQGEVSVRYMTENGKQDVLFVLIQSSRRNSVIVEDNVARNSKIAIVIDELKKWTQEVDTSTYVISEER